MRSQRWFDDLGAKVRLDTAEHASVRRLGHTFGKSTRASWTGAASSNTQTGP